MLAWATFQRFNPYAAFVMVLSLVMLYAING